MPERAYTERVPPQPLTTMDERRDQEHHNLLSLLHEAKDHGAHVFTQEELHPDVDFGDPDARLPRPSFQEVLYSYQGHHYQCILSGHNMYHHRLLGTVHSPRPYRRLPPTPAPWA